MGHPARTLGLVGPCDVLRLPLPKMGGNTPIIVFIR
jgi:hypothetical protein